VSDIAKNPHALRWVTGLGALAVVALDQGTKWWAESSLQLAVYHPLIGNLVGWQLVYNPGAAFGLARNFTWILTIVAAAAVVGLVIFALRNQRWSWGIGILALLGGAISHLGDRLFREPGFGEGHIVDFINYAGFFVGNVADIFLVVGALYLVVLSVVHDQRSTPQPDELPEQETGTP
jgi:signal peptidase II